MDERKGTRKPGAADLRAALLDVLHASPDGARGYFRSLQRTHPDLFVSLLGKLLPSELKAELSGAATLTLRIERSFVKAKAGDGT